MRFFRILFLNLSFCLLSYSLVAQNSIYNQSVEKFYNEGMEYVAKSSYSAARNSFENYLTLADNSPNIINAEYYRAYAALNLFHKDAEYLVEEFTNKYPNHPFTETANYQLGKHYFGLGNHDKTIDYLSKAENSKGLSNQERAEIHFKLGYSYFSKRKFKEASVHFNEIKNIQGEYFAAANYYAGYIEFKNKDYTEALKDLIKANESEAYQKIVPNIVAAIYNNIERYKELVEYVAPLINEQIANKRDLELLLADAYFQLENYEAANDIYNQYLEKTSIKNIPADLLYKIGYVAYLLDDVDKATQFFKSVAAINEDDLGYYASYYLGILYAKDGNKMYALTSFDKARTYKKNEFVKEESQYQYAKLNYDLGRSREAILSFETYADQYPEGNHISEVNDLISEAYFYSNDYDKAILYAESIQNKTPKIKEVYQKASYHKGIDEFNKSNYKEGVNYLKQSLKYTQQKDIEILAHFWLGESYAIGNKYDEAIKNYQKVIWNADNNSKEKLKARYGIAYMYYNKKSYPEALTSFKTYIQNADSRQDKVTYDDALVRLADCYYVTKQYRPAIDTYKRAIDLSQMGNDYAYLQLGILYGIEGEYDIALSNYSKVISNFSDSRYKDDAIYYKAQLQFEKGKFDESIRGFSTIIDNQPRSKFTPFAYLKRATSYYNTQQYDKCISDYQQLIIKYKRHKVAQQVLLPLQEVLAIQNRATEFDKFLAIYKQANPDDETTESIELEAAKTLYYSQQYDLAYNKLLNFIRDYPESVSLMEAYFFMGEINYYENKKDSAIVYYTRIFEDKNYVQYNRVLGRVAKIEQEQQRYSNAIYYYGKLKSEANNRKEQNTAFIGLMESFYSSTEFDSSAVYANKILTLGNANMSDQNKASLYIGKSAMAKGDFAKAKDAFLQTLNTAKDVNGAEAQYLLGEIYYSQEQYQHSIESLIELNSSFYTYDTWVGKGFLLIVDNYIAMKEFHQAKQTAISLIESFPLPEIVEQAKIKRNEIENILTNEFEISENNSTLVNSDTTLVNNDTITVVNDSTIIKQDTTYIDNE